MNTGTHDRLTVGDPFFLLYKSRSGSTYLANILAAHPDLGLAPESLFVRRLWNWSHQGTKKVANKQRLTEVLELISAGPQFATWQLSKENLFEHLVPYLPLAINELVRQIILAKCRQYYPSCSVWGMKGGGWYAENIRSLRSLFPQAKFIHLVRDGRAVFASSKNSVFPRTRLPFETDPTHSALRWKLLLSEVDKWTEPSCALEVQYEKLLTEPAVELRRILVFLGLNTENTVIEEMLRPHHKFYIPNEFLHLHPNVGKPPKPSRIHAWRENLTREEVRKFERIAGPMLKNKGYSLMYPRPLWDDVYMMGREGLAKGHSLVKRYLKFVAAKYAGMNRG